MAKWEIWTCHFLLQWVLLESWDSPHWLCSLPGSRCCSSWQVTAEGSRNHHSSCCPPQWRAVPPWGWTVVIQQQCNRVSPRWRHCGSSLGQKNTRGPQKRHGGSWTCAPPSQQAGRSWKINDVFKSSVLCCLLKQEQIYLSLAKAILMRRWFTWQRRQPEFLKRIKK